jgi:hypothetical protein
MDKSLSFATYSEDLPSIGYNGASYGAYARKHNPAANWMGTGKNQIPSNTNQPFSAYPTDFTKLPTVCYVVPNQNDDMHNGTDPSRITTADTWVKNHLDGYIQWAKTHNSLFILTFDEDNDNFGNRIVTIFTGPMVAAGKYSNQVDHYAVLRTIEDMYSLTHAGNAGSATTITNCWITAPVTSATNNSSNVGNNLTVFPNPATGIINFRLNKLPSSLTVLRIFDMTGRLQGQYQFAGTQNLKINAARLSAGTYYYSITQYNKVPYSGKFTVIGR